MLTNGPKTGDKTDAGTNARKGEKVNARKGRPVFREGPGPLAPNGDRTTGSKTEWALLRLYHAPEDEQQKVRERFDALCKPAPNGCILWNGTSAAKNQPIFSLYGVLVTSSRVAWVLHGNSPPRFTTRLLRTCMKGQECVAVGHFQTQPTLAEANRVKGKCPNGHPYEGRNLLMERTKSGRRQRRCVECMPFSLKAHAVYIGMSMEDVVYDEERGYWEIRPRREEGGEDNKSAGVI
jgi:hypothetical protein